MGALANAVIVCGLFVRDSSMWTSNFLGICFACQGIIFLKPGGFWNSSVMLAGLFFYDIFWVFGTEVMVTVAKKFDAPIKLLFKRPDMEKPNLLGLGDIVLPGMLVAVLLRFDWCRGQS